MKNNRAKFMKVANWDWNCVGGVHPGATPHPKFFSFGFMDQAPGRRLPMSLRGSAPAVVVEFRLPFFIAGQQVEVMPEAAIQLR